MVNSSKRREAPRLSRDGTVDLDQLDLLLDVPVAQWERQLKKLVKEFRGKRLRLQLPQSRMSEVDLSGSSVTWVGLFEAQVRQLPRMDRAEEFRMARRYEFQKAVVLDALIRAGHRPAVASELVLRPCHTLPEATRRAAPGARQRLEQVVAELEHLRNLYVEGSLYLVHGPVRRYTGLGVDDVDLIQESAASLFQAIEGFDWRREVRFKTYAVYWVQQAILKTLYNASRTVRVPIWVQKAYRKIRKLQDQGVHETGVLPDPLLIGRELDMPAERVEEILAVRRYAVSLDAPISSGEEGFSLSQSLPDDSAQPLHETVVEGDLHGELAAVLEELPDRERLILHRRFGLDGGEPETLAEIAQDLGVTAERVRQLQKAALERLQRPRPMERLKMFA